ncbi:MAG: M20/M25/M40 family metallo-hydrolase [Acholeplasmataceae bacterium]|nr:M20/M25/M40 family metallo-hydrolase [Acholeplasmataceae bacterium]
MIVLYLLLGALVLALIVAVIRTFGFKPSDNVVSLKETPIDETRAVESLSKMIQFKTISHADGNLIELKAFEDFQNYLKSRYPLINQHATFTLFDKAMLFHIKGDSKDDPIVLMSHYDVVPTEGSWSFPPFSGKVTSTHVCGRGTLDTKSSLNAIMEATEHLLKSGKRFNRDIYLAFGGDEEVSGISAPMITEHLKSQGITPAMVLDEGGAIVTGMFPGVKKKAAVVGIAEKGFMNLRLVVESAGGHASSPPASSPLTELAAAISKLNNHPAFQMRLSAPVKALFDTVARHSTSFGIRMIFANLWLFLPIVKLLAKSSGGELLSMFKTTQAFTQAKGSDAINVLPARAEVGVNYRIAIHESTDRVLSRIKTIINNPNIKIEVLEASEPTTVSQTDQMFDTLATAINSTWKDVVVTPYLMVATTDSRHYHAISDHVYKFSPMDVSKDDLKKIHGIDEDISIENVHQGVRFYIHLLSQF